MRRFDLIVLAGLAAPPFAPASDAAFRITVDARGVPRRNSPITARLAVGKEIEEPQVANLPAAFAVESTGEPATAPLFQAEVARRADGKPDAILIHWIDRLEPDEKRTYDVRLGAPNPSKGMELETFRFASGDGYRDILLGEKPVWRHMIAYDPARREHTYKPYHHIYCFHGDRFITKGPGGTFSHHRGVFLGWNKTRIEKKTYDYWHCPDVAQRHAGYQTEREIVGPVLARTASVTDWLDPEGKVVARDTREVATWRQPDGQFLIDFNIAIEPAAGSLQLDGDPQHAGFQFRAAEEVAEREKETVYVLPAGTVKKPNDVVEKCGWAACLFKVHKKPYAVVHMNHPGNHPDAVYSTRAYGRVGVFFKAEVKAGAPLRLRYRLLLLDTEKDVEVSIERFERKHQDFITPVGITIERR